MPTPSAPADPLDRMAVEIAYKRFWAVAQAVDSRPVGEWHGALAAVAGDPVLTRIYDGLVALRASGRRQYGWVVAHVGVVDLRGDRASVRDCQDARWAGELDAETGLPATAGAPRTPVAAVLVRGPDRIWRVVEARYLEGSC